MHQLIIYNKTNIYKKNLHVDFSTWKHFKLSINRGKLLLPEGRKYEETALPSFIFLAFIHFFFLLLSLVFSSSPIVRKLHFIHWVLGQYRDFLSSCPTTAREKNWLTSKKWVYLQMMELFNIDLRSIWNILIKSHQLPVKWPHCSVNKITIKTFLWINYCSLKNNICEYLFSAIILHL